MTEDLIDVTDISILVRLSMRTVQNHNPLAQCKRSNGINGLIITNDTYVRSCLLLAEWWMDPKVKQLRGLFHFFQSSPTLVLD
jgi:hypothetical protein